LKCYDVITEQSRSGKTCAGNPEKRGWRPNLERGWGGSDHTIQSKGKRLMGPANRVCFKGEEKGNRITSGDVLGVTIPSPGGSGLRREKTRAEKTFSGTRGKATEARTCILSRRPQLKKKKKNNNIYPPHQDGGGTKNEGVGKSDNHALATNSA